MTQFLTGIFLGWLLGLATFYSVPKLRPLIRDRFLPWVRGLRK